MLTWSTPCHVGVMWTAARKSSLMLCHIPRLPQRQRRKILPSTTVPTRVHQAGCWQRRKWMMLTRSTPCHWPASQLAVILMRLQEKQQTGSPNIIKTTRGALIRGSKGKPDFVNTVQFSLSQLFSNFFPSRFVFTSQISKYMLFPMQNI